jgi:hypothetical protein
MTVNGFRLAQRLSPVILFSASASFAGSSEKPAIPEEYLTTGEQTTALSNGGSISSAGYSAVRANPAMISIDRVYAVGGGYHWPSKGREFYEGGVVDGKTAPIAAGLSYTSSHSTYEGQRLRDGIYESSDTPVKRRGALALGYSFRTVAIGLSGGMVEAANPTSTLSTEDDRLRGFTAGAGMMAGITPSLRAGLSVENLANRDVSFAAPTIYRAGLAWAAVQNFNVYFDLRRRQAIDIYEAQPPTLSLFGANAGASSKSVDAENAMMVGGMAKIYDLLRVSLASGVSSTGSTSTVTTSGGLALVNRNFAFSYSAQKPDAALSAVHHAVNLGIDISL